MDVISFFSDFALGSESSHDLLSYLYTLPSVYKPLYFRQMLIFSTNDINKTVREACFRNQIEIISSNEKTYTFVLSREYGQKKYVKGTICFLPSESEGFYYLFSVSDSAFWNYLVRYLIRNTYPRIKSIFYKQNEIIKVLNYLVEKNNLNMKFRVKEVTTKEKRGKIYKFDTERRWTDLSVDQLFSQGSERNQLFISIVLKVYIARIGVEKLVESNEIKVYKNGEIFTRNLDENLVKDLNKRLEVDVRNRFNLYKDRGLRNAKKIMPKPLEVTFDSEVFSNIDEFNRFRNLIKKYPNSNKTIIHSNPYFYLTISDFIDGSSFDLWVVESNKISLVPQSKSSQQGFEKLIKYIFENFKEGTIKEMEI